MIDIFGEVVNNESKVDEPDKPKKVGLFDWLNNLNYDKKPIFNDETEKDFSSFMINRGMSQNVETIMFANEMNKHPLATKNMVYDFYFYIVSKKKRFSKWAKKDSTNEDDIKLVMDHYQINRNRANEYLRILNKNDIDKIKSMYVVGGKKK